MSSWTEQREHYQTLAREHAPSAVLVTKDHWFWRVVARMLWLASVGQFSPQTFLRDYATTFGPIQAYPRHWRELSRPLLVHECRHSRQCELLGWLFPFVGWFHRGVRSWLGLLPMGLLYLCFPLPIGLCAGRLWLELDAERTSWRASLRHGWLTEDQVRQQAIFFADRVSSAHYLWTWPKAWTRELASRMAEREMESSPQRD